MLIDIAIPGDRNVIEKEAEKILKYKDVIIEIQRMWNVKAKLILVITGATGTISKLLRQYLRNLRGKHEIKELQKKTAVLGTAHKLWEVLM
jgi:galactokinase/mevalonate kinase-like predicted kinase